MPADMRYAKKKRAGRPSWAVEPRIQELHTGNGQRGGSRRVVAEGRIELTLTAGRDRFVDHLHPDDAERLANDLAMAARLLRHHYEARKRGVTVDGAPGGAA